MTNPCLGISVLRINPFALSNKILFNYSEAHEWLTIFCANTAYFLNLLTLFQKSIFVEESPNNFKKSQVDHDEISSMYHS